MTVKRTRQEFEAEVIKKTWEDDKFRQELLANPKATLAKFFDIAFPENVSLAIHEESPTRMHLVLPTKPGTDGSEELSDDDLSSVAGGFGGGQETMRYCPGSGGSGGQGTSLTTNPYVTCR